MPSHLATAPGARGVHPGTIGQCATCSRARQARRPSRQARGYDAEYDRNAATIIRGALAAAAAGESMPCLSGDGPCLPGQAITAGHIVALRDGGTNELENLAPQHAACNYAWNRGQRRRKRGFF